VPTARIDEERDGQSALSAPGRHVVIGLCLSTCISVNHITIPTSHHAFLLIII
jgi:hypothetical protein